MEIFTVTFRTTNRDGSKLLVNNANKIQNSLHSININTIHNHNYSSFLENLVITEWLQSLLNASY